MKTLTILEKYLVYLVIVLFGIFILNNSTSPIFLSKIELVTGALSLIIILWLLKSFLRGKTSFAIGKYDLGVLLVALVYVIATLTRTPNKMEAFLIPGTSTLLVISAITYFVINQFDKKIKSGIAMSLFVSGLLTSLCILLTQVDLFAKVRELPSFIKDPLLSTLGGTIPSIIFLIPILVLGIGLALREKDVIKKVFWAVSATVVIMALIISVGNSLPGKSQSPKFPSIQTSWDVAVETVKQSPLLGIGPGNYLTAFNLYRPVSYNQTGLWSVRFTTASDFYFTAIAEAGLIGLAAFAILFFTIGKSVTESINSEKLALITLVVLFAFFPVSPILMFPFFIILALNSNSETNIKHLSGGRPFLGLVGVIILTGIGIFDFVGVKAIVAENTYMNSLAAWSSGDAAKTYTLMQKAISVSPNVDRYHSSLAQVELAIASGLASKKDITDTDKTTVTQLVQQAINEGKSTVILNPQRSGNWEILAQIYRSIIPFAGGADQFAIETYTQAVSLYPTNPNLRIALGGVYYALGNYNKAIDSFKLAVLAKPDLANAHYNLAIAYQTKKDFDNAIVEMNSVLGLVKLNSQDYVLAQSSLEQLKKSKAALNTTSSSENLSSPQGAGTSNIKPPITLPLEANPPAATNQ